MKIGASLLALPLLLPVQPSEAANAIDFFMWMHNRHTVNAVVFDGNTCLQTNSVWNPPANAEWLFLNWAEQPAATNRQERTNILEAEASDGSQSVEISEVFNAASGNADIEVFIDIGGNQTLYRSVTALIPRNGLWHTVFLSLDTVDQVGDVMVVESPTGNYEFETMQPSTGGATTINWPTMDVYNVGCYATMPMAEFYADLGQYHWLLPQAAADFVMQLGYSIGLSTTAASHDCAAPSAASAIPQMCHTGNANFFPHGPEGGPGLFAYELMTITGALTTAPSDPCLRRGIGDGCIAP